MPFPKKEYKWIILPVENFVREFHAKLLLAAVAAERGYASVFMYKSIIKRDLPKIHGVVIDINMKKGKQIDRFLNNGWKVCAIDEEGLIYLNGEEYVHRRVDKEGIKKIDRVFVWGNNQYQDIIKHVTGVEERLIVSGNPRFDLLRPELRTYYADKTSTYRKNFGRYILVNTNFGYANHYFGKEALLRGLRYNKKITTKEQELDQFAREKHQDYIMKAFIEMLPALSKHFPDRNIIVRPHPSEDFNTWRSVVDNLPNAFMIHESDAVPWLMGAEVIIHNSCTTGVQGYLLDRPVISYMPVQSEKYDHYLPNALSIKVESLEKLVEMVDMIISHPDLLDKDLQREKLLVTQQFISAMDGPLAADRIMDEIEKLDVHPDRFDPHTYSGFLSADQRSGWKASQLARTLRKIKHKLSGVDSKASSPKEINWTNYTNQRFPTLSFDEVKDDLEKLHSITGRFANVRSYHSGNGMLWIFPAED